MSQARHLGDLEGPDAAQLGRVTRMLILEGVMLVGMLVAGGIALLIAIRLEQRRRRDMRAFFMAFTHDLKTSLASLRLQAEALREDLPEAAGNPNLQRMLKDSVRLQLQLENALFLTKTDGAVFIEAIHVRTLVDYLRDDLPELANRCHRRRARARRSTRPRKHPAQPAPECRRAWPRPAADASSSNASRPARSKLS